MVANVPPMNCLIMCCANPTALDIGIPVLRAMADASSTNVNSPSSRMVFNAIDVRRT